MDLTFDKIMQVKKQIEDICPPLYYAVTDLQAAGSVTYMKTEDKESILINPDDWPKIKDSFGYRKLQPLNPKAPNPSLHTDA